LSDLKKLHGQNFLQASPVQFVVWDLDGTLADTLADIAWALNARFGELGLSAIETARVRNLIGHGVAQLVRRGFSSHGIELDDATLEVRLDRFIEIYSARPVGDAHLYSGVAAALDQLRDAGIPQAVCTNKSTSISEAILATLGVRSYFACVTGGDSTARCKPDPLPIEFTAECLGLRLTDGIMIGDSPADARAARSAGMPVAIVDYGYSQVPVASIDCDYRVADIESFASHIVSLRSS
jgi:phosphoglycolate phosphatase